MLFIFYPLTAEKLFRQLPKGVYSPAKHFRHAPTANGVMRNIS